MIYLTTNHGTGDSYMTLAFAKAVERHRGQPVTVCLPPGHEAIAAMFPDVMIRVGEPLFNALQDDLIVAHPSAVPKRVRIDHLCLLSRRLTHADLWRAMLDLSPDEPFPRGTWKWPQRQDKKAFLIPQARSWPNAYPEFWAILEMKLRVAGWAVEVSSPSLSLAEVFDRCAAAEWVIGANCGVTNIICHAMFPCRKTIVCPSVDGHSYFKRTYPYGYVGTFAGEDYADVDEVKIISSVLRSADDVMAGANAARIKRRGLVSGVQMTLSYGDFFDRLSILEIKTERLSGDKRAAIYREYLQHFEAAVPVLDHFGSVLRDSYLKIKNSNAAAWDHNEKMVGAVFSGGAMTPDAPAFAETALFNRERVRLKNQINAICGSSSDEIKSYYGGEEA